MKYCGRIKNNYIGSLFRFGYFMNDKNYIRPKKSLGQHFLHDKLVARKIVDSLTCDNTGKVLEIGPGKGILTELLVQKNNFKTAVIELDIECINYLKENLGRQLAEIIHRDFLKFDLTGFTDKKIALIGNFPYHISGPIFFKLLENRNLISEVVCMIQKEVAERICSPPGNKVYGILSVLLQSYFNINYLFTVKPGAFNPPPKVNSAVIKLIRNENYELNCDERLFFKLVKTAFNQRRKILRNSIKSIISDKFDQPILLKRPEQLHYSEFIYLTNLITGFNK